MTRCPAGSAPIMIRPMWVMVAYQCLILYIAFTLTDVNRQSQSRQICTNIRNIN